MTVLPDEPEPSRQAFHYKSYRLFWFAVMSATFSVQIMSVSVGWQIYDLTRNPFYLGLIGLVQFLPALLLVLVTGLVADTFPRRVIMAICLGIEVVCALSLLFLAGRLGEGVLPVFGVLAVLGLARAFMGPASTSLAPNLVPPQALANAVSINMTAWQLSGIVGPVTGGLLYGISAQAAYGTAAVLSCAAVVLVLLIPKPPQRKSTQATSIETILGGFRYILKEKVVLGAISLDLFAVLLGGAVALMPVYARDILDVGPWGLGLLRGAPGAGAILMALWLLRYPVKDHAGIKLFIFVGLFGLFTLIFGLSTTVWISIPALMLVGASDMVSVILRETLMQLWTPDEVRGRVNAVNSVFIGASNELGEFRAGMMAAAVGTVVAVSAGGAATIGVAAIWSRMFPQLRTIRTIDRRMA